jgi:tetratricopeptide (TPR) repeat protein
MAGSAQAGDPVKLLTAEPKAVLNDEQVPAQPLPAVVAPEAAKEAKPVATKAVPGPSKVEAAALYYYAEMKQDTRVEAEFRRLKLKYPGFALPTDLYAPAATVVVDEKLLWSLYEKNDFAGVEAEIARRRTETPDWSPTADFTAKYARKKTRAAIETALKVKDWTGVIAAAATIDPTTEKEPDLVWAMIDAQSALGGKDALATLYRAMLFRDPAHALPKPAVIATIQKATRDFSTADIQAVITHFSGDPVITAGLSSVSLDLVRKAVADFNQDEKRKDRIADESIARLVEAASGEGAHVADFSLLGWYDLKIGEPAEAGAWFRRALDAEDNVEHVKGLYLSLVRQERQEEAYDIALQHREALAADPVFLMNALAERVSKPETGGVDAAAVKAYSEAILATKNGDHAEILAWYAYNSGQYQASRAWFGKAFGWEPEEIRLKGLALSEAQLGDRDGLIALYQRYAAKYPEIWDDIHLSKPGKRARAARQDRTSFIDRMKVGAVDPMSAPRSEARPQARVTSASSGYVAALQSRRFGDCIASLLAEEARKALPADAQLVKGWCLMGLNRTAEAKTAFSAALSGNGRTRSDAAYGLSLTLLRGKLTDEAEAVASLYPLGEARDREVRSEIYWQKARSSFDAKQYQRTLDALNARIAITPEPPNMSQLRAWSHYNLGHVAEARAIFARLSAHLDDPGARRGLAETSGLAHSEK